MKNLAWLLATAAVLAGLFVWLRPAPDPAPATATPMATPAIAAAKIFELRVADKKLIAGEPVLRVIQGDDVVLRITSDKADELHLHGYDLSLHLHANQSAELKFRADRSGRFDYELHHSHVDLGALEVTPK